MMVAIAHNVLCGDQRQKREGEWDLIFRKQKIRIEKKGQRRTLSFEWDPINLVLNLRGDVRLMIKVENVIIELWLE
jgi:hypothetical protein